MHYIMFKVGISTLRGGLGLLESLFMVDMAGGEGKGGGGGEGRGLLESVFVQGDGGGEGGLGKGGGPCWKVSLFKVELARGGRGVLLESVFVWLGGSGRQGMGEKGAGGRRGGCWKCPCPPIAMLPLDCAKALMVPCHAP